MNPEFSLATSCWSEGGARAVLRTEALTARGGIFLATHTPIRDFSVGGSERASILDASEEGVLDALADPGRRHAFAVVRGEAGSGKSHLIQWLEHEWPRNDGRDIVILLQRASASLEGSLRELRSKLSSTAPAYASIIGDFGTRQAKSFKGKLADFFSKLANSLRPDYLEKPPADVAFCQTHSPADILASPVVQREWKAPERVLKIMTNEDGKRDSETAAFSPYEMPELFRFKETVHSVKAQQLLNRLDREAPALDELRDTEWSDEEVIERHRDKAPFAVDLAKALNARTNAAIQESLGVPASKLKEIFFELRRAMKRDGHRLVLLLEDITAFQGLDDALIDVLVADSTTNDELCDQISVVGLTPSYYRQHLQANYRQRITHDISLGDGDDGSLQDVASFRSSEARSQFVATYLSAARAGPQAIEAWAAASRSNGERTPPPNPCNSCIRRTDCHAVFGAREGIGLFPFTEHAIQTFFSALKQSDNGSNWQTPRGIIQGVLTPTLMRPYVLDEGQYPSADVTSHDALEPNSTSLSHVIEQRLSGIDDPMVRDRAKRLIAFWGTRRDPSTTKVGTDTFYAGVSADIFSRLGLPWIGQEDPILARPTPPAPEAIAGEDQKPESDATSAGVTARQADATNFDESRSRSAPLRQPSDPSKTLARDPANTPRAVRQKMRVNASEHERLPSNREEFLRSGALLPSIWDRLAFDLVSRIDPRRIDTTPVVFGTLLNENNVKFAGTTTRMRGSYFTVPAESWAFDALMAISDSKQPDFKRASDGLRDVNRRTITKAIRLIEPLIREHIEKRSPVVEGNPLSLDRANTAILTVRAWLRGDVSPLAPLAQQWAAILRDEQDVRSDPKARVPSWDETLTLSHRHHAKLREQIRDAVRLTQGAGAGALLDAADGIATIKRLVEEFKLPDYPPEDGREGIDELYEYPISILAETTAKIGRLPRAEFDRLANASAAIDKMLRGSAIDEHIDRVDRAITATDAKLSQKLAIVGQWKQSLARFQQPAFDARLTEVEDSIDYFLAHPAPPEKRVGIVDLVARQPAAAIGEVESLLKIGEEALQRLAEAARDQIGSLRDNTLTIDQLHRLGAECRELAMRSIAALGGSE
jgi:hypothetical protein